MLTIILIVLLVVACVVFGAKKTLNKVKATGSEVIELLTIKKDPIVKLKEQIKAYKLKLAELFQNTLGLKGEIGKQISRRDRAQVVADTARDKGNRGDALEAFTMVKSAETSIESLRADVTANDDLYETMSKSLSGRQLQLSKFESAAKRREMRSSANTIRRDIAKDELLEEGLFSADLDDETCQEEIEAIAIEKVNSDLKGGDVLERYEDTSDHSEEFNAFFGEKSDG
jgi:hypothetical protein